VLNKLSCQSSFRDVDFDGYSVMSRRPSQSHSFVDILGGISLLAAQAIPPIHIHFSVAWSVCPVVSHIRAPCLNRSMD